MSKIMKKIYNILIVFGCAILFIVACQKNDSSSNYNGDTNGGSNSGKGGSLARFTIAGDYLYTVDNTNLKSFNISNESQPVFSSEISAGFNIETIFARSNVLFLGSQNGMYIYDITVPNFPVKLCCYQHIYSCDPVVADDKYAYVTLSTTSRCGRNVNELQIIDIQNLSSPYFVKSYAMTQPNGLGIDNGELFVCDEGLKVYDATDVKNLKLKYKFNIPAIDVIPIDNHLMVLAENGLFQYSYVNGQVNLLSALLTINE
jgi:hypothetical protein